MINFKLFKDRVGVLHGFSLSGHANFAKSGQDIVCAAVSVLVINTINSIEQFTDDTQIVESDEKHGFIKCDYPNPKSEGADILLNAMILGLSQTKEQYGENLQISEVII